MAQITEKELTAIGDIMNIESVMCAKCHYMARNTQDAALKDCYERMAQRHQRHLDELFSNMK